MSDGQKYLAVFVGLIALLLLAGAPGVGLLFLGVGLLIGLIVFVGVIILVGLGVVAGHFKEKQEAKAWHDEGSHDRAQS